MIFRQLFESESSTYTYLVACRETGEAILVDPVLETIERDLGLLQDLELTLTATLETHIHADHLTSACRLRSLTGCKVAYPDMDGLPCADIGVSELKPLALGSLTLKPLFTPGHTDTHHSYLLDMSGSLRIMTGDALLIDGCGRTDFQDGDATTLYNSVYDKLFGLPGDMRSFELNAEVSLICYGSQTANDLQRVENQYLEQSMTVDLESWKERSLPKKILENSARMLSDLL